MKPWTTCLCAILLLSATHATAEIDQDRMKRDLTIMESVLARFFETDDENVNGFYLPDHGVVLIARESKPAVRQVYVKVLKTGDRAENPVQTKAEEPAADRAEQLKTQVAEFLGTYADAIGQLKDRERVTIIVLSDGDFDRHLSDRADDMIQFLSDRIEIDKKPGLTRYRIIGENADSNDVDTVQVEKKVYRTPSRRHSIEIEERVDAATERMRERMAHAKRAIRVRLRADKDEDTERQAQSPLEASVSKQDIDAVSRGKIDQKAFMDRITFREDQTDPTLEKKIEVMADILDATLGQNGGDHGVFGRTNSTGIYLQSLGAVFFTSHRSEHFVWTYAEDDQKRSEDPAEKLKTELITAVADYGATLRGLKSDEWIVVHLNLGNQARMPFVQFLHGEKDNKWNLTTKKKMPQRILLRVQKKHTEAYAVGKLDLDAFREKVIITEM